MKKLHFKNFFEDFLYDLDDFITIYDHNIHVFHFLKLNKLSNKEIILTLDKRIVKINGEDLLVQKMSKEELLIKGLILKVEFIYEK